MSVLNSTVLERAWLSGTSDFQQRIPNPSTSGYAATVEQLFNPLNGDLFNEFGRILNGLNATYVDIRRFENPLAVLKRNAADWRFGSSERHLAVHYLQGHAPKFDDETLLKVERPEFEEWFYSLNYENRYEFSWSRYELQQAFSADGYGYDQLLQATITQMYSSASYDEMNVMLQTFCEADRRMGGLYRYNVSAMPNDEATAKELLKAIRTVAGYMRFPSMRYNHLPVPVHTDGSRLILYVLPEVMASIDVDALSAVFQLDRANPEEVLYRIIPVPEFPIPNVVAILADEDFIYWRDYMTGMEPPFYNPGNRTLKYYYYASAAVGCNPAAPVCCFTTEEETVIPTITMAISGATLAPADNVATVEIGGTKQLAFNLTGTVTNGSGTSIAVEPDAATYEVSATDAEAENAIALNMRTYVDKYGVLHVQKSGLSATDVITVTAKSAYVNPSGDTTEYTASTTLTVVAPTVHGAKECPVATEPYIEYTATTDEATASE